ncbi:basic salivary proline-rich protein 3-like isoform X2 [Cavia porcellus]|uniref:basic salivary proline-rich protein 3-like isoform X2 n=1 Tax=Cavia porcellus TaxID=10141 RepID=UPI002FE06D80
MRTQPELAASEGSDGSSQESRNLGVAAFPGCSWRESAEMWPRQPRGPPGCAGPHVCNPARRSEKTKAPPARSGDHVPAGGSRGMPEGAAAEPPHSGDTSPPGWPARSWRAAPPPRPAPLDGSGRVAARV